MVKTLGGAASVLSLVAMVVALTACAAKSDQKSGVLKTTTNTSSSIAPLPNLPSGTVGGTTTTTTPAPNPTPVVTLTGRKALITDVYKSMLGRAVQDAELNYWSQMTCVQVLAGVAGSDEFQSRVAGLSDISYVEALYLGVLGRPYDDVGRATYVNRLYAAQYVNSPAQSARVARGAVVAPFVNSDEAAARCATYNPF